MDNMPKQEEGLSTDGKSAVAKSKAGAFVGGVLVVALAALIGGSFYARSQAREFSQNKYVLTAAKVFGFSAAKVNNQKIAYVDFLKDYNALTTFYKKQPAGYPAPSEGEIREQALSRLIVEVVVDDLAKEYAVKIEPDDLDKGRSDLLSQFPDKATAEKEIGEYYGFTLDEYVDRILSFLLLQEKIAKAYLGAHPEITDDTKVKEQAEQVLARIKAGEDFATLAKEFGSDGTKDSGGSLGWFGKNEMVPEFEQAAFVLKAGELSPELVKTIYGYHIVKVDEKRKDPETDAEQVSARHILFKVSDGSAEFNQVVEEKLKAAKIEIFIPVADPVKKMIGTETSPAAE